MKKEATVEDYYLRNRVKDETLAKSNRDHIESMPQWFPLVTIRFVQPRCRFAQKLGISSENPKIMMHYCMRDTKPPAIYLYAKP